MHSVSKTPFLTVKRGPNKRRIKPAENNELLALALGVDDESEEDDEDFEVNSEDEEGTVLYCNSYKIIAILFIPEFCITSMFVTICHSRNSFTGMNDFCVIEILTSYTCDKQPPGQHNCSGDILDTCPHKYTLRLQ